MDLPPDFSDLLAELARAGVESVIVGGYAVAFHARPRATKDIDIVLRASPENLGRAASALQRFGAPPNVVEAIRTMAESDIVYLGQPPLRIDFMVRIDGVEAEALFPRAIETTWGGQPVHVIALDDLVANKRAAGRPQDLLDVELLERAKSRPR